MKIHLHPVPGFILGLIVSISAFALEDDRNQPIEVEADNLEIRDNENISIYSGNVSLVQGSMQIRSDRMVIHFNDVNEIQLMEMTGKPATFRQLDEEGKEILGRADRMDYDEPNSFLVFTGNARLDNGGNTIEGSTIRINTETDNIEAKSDQAEDRVRVVIQPRLQKDNR